MLKNNKICKLCRYKKEIKAWSVIKKTKDGQYQVKIMKKYDCTDSKETPKNCPYLLEHVLCSGKKEKAQ